MLPGEAERFVALGVLSDYERRDAYLGPLLSSRLRSSNLDTRQKSFVTELVQGTVRMMGNLDWVIRNFSRRKLDSVDTGVLWILRLSAYQIMYTEVPDYAACDTGVRLARKEAGEGVVSYVNGVLRALARGLKSIHYPDPVIDPAGYLEARYSHPAWITRMWIAELGLEKAEQVCMADNRAPRVSIRCNANRKEKAGLAESLNRRGIEVESGTVAPEALLIKGSGPLQELDEYKKGWFSVQDQGAMLVGHRVEARKGMRVCDMCAAPGGKSNHLAELMRNDGRILALDRDPVRLERVNETAVRLGNKIIETRVMDATTVTVDSIGSFDRVLLDVPCSGLGTLARRPDIRWRRRQEDILRLAALQCVLMERAATIVRPGGMLTYSTCTISRAENEDVLRDFLRKHRDFIPVPVEDPGETRHFTQLFPDSDRCDGTFVAVLLRMD